MTSGRGGGSEEAIGNLLAQEPWAIPEQMSLTRRLIKENPNSPRLLELKYFLGQEMLGASSDKAYQRALLSYFDKLAALAADSKNDLLAFKAKSCTGNIARNALHDPEEAYAIYRKLEHHPALSEGGIESDYLRCELYDDIAETASMEHPAEREKYSKLEMEYPYLDLPFGSDDFARFARLYQRAGTIQIQLHSDEPDVLRGLDIPPSQPGLVYARKRALGEPVAIPLGWALITQSDPKPANQN